jgi:hypothetical protein
MKDINLPDNISLINKTINCFNHQHPNFDPLDTSDFFSNDYKQYYYQAFISDKGNITLEFPITADANPASIVISKEFNTIKTNHSFKKELERVNR